MLPAVAGGESWRTSCGTHAASGTESDWAHGKRSTGTPRPRTFRCGAGRSPGLRVAAAPSGLPSADGRQWQEMTERLTAHSCGGSPGLAAGRGSPGSLLASGGGRRKNQYRHHSWGTPPFRSSFVNEGLQKRLGNRDERRLRGDVRSRCARGACFGNMDQAPVRQAVGRSRKDPPAFPDGAGRFAAGHLPPVPAANPPWADRLPCQASVAWRVITSTTPPRASDP